MLVRVAVVVVEMHDQQAIHEGLERVQVAGHVGVPGVETEQQVLRGVGVEQLADQAGVAVFDSHLHPAGARLRQQRVGHLPGDLELCRRPRKGRHREVDHNRVAPQAADEVHPVGVQLDPACQRQRLALFHRAHAVDVGADQSVPIQQAFRPRSLFVRVLVRANPMVAPMKEPKPRLREHAEARLDVGVDVVGVGGDRGCLAQGEGLRVHVDGPP